jgi:ferric-dicitrate binding protein FerR (iron transport regulator)
LVAEAIRNITKKFSFFITLFYIYDCYNSKRDKKMRQEEYINEIGDLILKSIKGEMSADETIRLRDWREESADNERIYKKLTSHYTRNDYERFEGAKSSEGWSAINKRIAKPARIISLRRMIAVAAAAVIAAIVGLHVVDFMDKNSISTRFQYSTLSGKSKVYLPDGTLVWLHNNSTISYNSDFGQKDRTVSFVGDAYFEVAHNEAVPFTVETGDITVKVHGTKFNLRNRDKEAETTVSLVEGSVSVVSDRQVAKITPGYEAIYNKNSDIIYTEKGDVELAKNWASEAISFNGKTLSYITERLERWYDVDIQVNEKGLDDAATYSFTVHDEPMEEIMRYMVHINKRITYKFDLNNTLHINVKP